MPLIFTQHYSVELIDSNPHMSCMYIESQKKTGGGRHTTFIRGYLRGMPIRLREDYTEKGYLISVTESRDRPQIDKDFNEILQKLRSMCIVCLPIIPFQTEITNLEKHSPKMAELVVKRMTQIKEFL